MARYKHYLQYITENYNINLDDVFSHPYEEKTGKWAKELNDKVKKSRFR